MSLPRHMNKALGVVTGLVIAAILTPEKPLRASNSAEKVLPPDLGPTFIESVRDLAASHAGSPLERAQIAILADRVVFTHPHSSAVLLVLTESLTSPWFFASFSTLSPHEVQALLGALARRLHHSPWRIASAVHDGLRSTNQAGNPWADEPMRNLSFTLVMTAAFWTLSSWVLLANARKLRREKPQSTTPRI